MICFIERDAVLIYPKINSRSDLLVLFRFEVKFIAQA